MFLVFHVVRIKFNGCLSVQILFGVPDTMSFPFTLYTDNFIIFQIKLCITVFDQKKV